MGWDRIPFSFFSFFSPIYVRHEKKRKHVVCRSLSWFVVVCYYYYCTSSNSIYSSIYSISSSLHACTLQRPLDRCKPQSGLLIVAVSISFMQHNKKRKEIKTKTKMCGDACETGSVDLGGWMNATYLYIYGPLSFFSAYTGTEVIGKLNALFTDWMSDWLTIVGIRSL